MKKYIKYILFILSVGTLHNSFTGNICTPYKKSHCMEHLYRAISQNDIYTIKKIINKRKIRNNINNQVGTGAIAPLHLAVFLDNYTAVRELLKCPNIEVNLQRFTNGNTPLHISIEAKALKSLLELIQHPNININIQNYDGNTPLHLAVLSNNKEIIKILKNTYPTINTKIRNIHNQTVFDIIDAIENKQRRQELEEILTAFRLNTHAIWNQYLNI